MAFATKQRLLLGLAVLMMCMPTILNSAGLLGRAPVFEGDVRKEMTCLSCDGLGQSGEQPGCDTCRGRGVADYIIPGPNRPIQLVGTVFDSHSGRVEGADITARQSEGDRTEVLLKTNDEGQFGIKLPPGKYTLKVTSENEGSVEKNLVIEKNTEPLPARSLDTLHKLEEEFHLKQ